MLRCFNINPGRITTLKHIIEYLVFAVGCGIRLLIDDDNELGIATDDAVGDSLCAIVLLFGLKIESDICHKL
jgi:hypothetical protein